MKKVNGTSKLMGASRWWVLWLASLILWLPTMIPYACHFLLPPHPEVAKYQLTVPTGFIQTDQPYYMINARQHFDEQGFHLFYGSPFSRNEDTPRIYFHPHILLLGLVWKVTGWNPATVYLLFGFICGVICLRVALAVFKELFGLASFLQWITVVLWVWGGGLLALVGIPRSLWTGNLSDLFYFDPVGGMWFLNLGRNLIYPTEAYYHAVFLGAIYYLIRRRFGMSFCLTALLSMSHPFTGIELILILLSWALLEMWCTGGQKSSSGPVATRHNVPGYLAFLPRNLEIPAWWVGGLVLLAVLHLGYNFLFLGSFEEHRSLKDQWTLDWTYEIQHFIPAYALVGAFAFWSMRTLDRARKFLSSSRNRFFFMWFVVAFALANHEFAIKPAMQPLHFTRGYVWMPLFLLGAPALIELLGWLTQRPIIRWIAMAGVACLFLMDNALFLTTFHFRYESGAPEVYVRPSYEDLAEILNKPANRGSLVVCPNPELNYWLLLYCPVRMWYSHLCNTPYVEQRSKEIREFVLESKFLPAWKDRPLLAIFPTAITPDNEPRFYEMLARHKMEFVHRNADYQVYRYTPPSQR